MNEQIIPTEGQIESGEARHAETQTLDDVTYEPRTYVETGNDYQAAEDKQENLVSVTENALSAAENKGASPLPIPQPESVELSPDDVKVETKNTAENLGASPLPIPHEADHANGDVGSGKLGVDPLTSDEFGGEHSANKPERILPENLPEAKVMGIGMGPNGMIEKGVNVSNGMGGLVNGSSSSGGGAPVSVPGGGFADGEDYFTENTGPDTGDDWDGTTDENGNGICCDLVENPFCDDQLMINDQDGSSSLRVYTIEGVSPIPYTGSGSWGSEPDPDLVGGPDKESGHFTPIVSINGKSVGGGGGSSDDPDDSGKFHGDPNLTASGSRPNNPDDPDYYTPNILEDVSKTANVTK